MTMTERLSSHLYTRWFKTHLIYLTFRDTIHEPDSYMYGNVSKQDCSTQKDNPDFVARSRSSYVAANVVYK